jgi:hypothetical protein
MIFQFAIYFIDGKLAFYEAAQMIQFCLHQLNYMCSIYETLEQRPYTIWIIFGLNNNPSVQLPPGAIIVNLEQFYDGSPWVNSKYLEQLRTHRVWDYNKINQTYLYNLGIHVDLIQYGYLPFLESSPCWANLSDQPRINQDIDVLILGAINPHRRQIYNELKHHGVNVEFHNKLWGNERSLRMTRSKILLNLHYYKSAILEIPRLSLAINNGMFIISESCINETEYSWMHDCVIFRPSSELIPTVLDYLTRPADRYTMAKLAYQRFKCIEPIVPSLDYLII